MLEGVGGGAAILQAKFEFVFAGSGALRTFAAPLQPAAAAAAAAAAESIQAPCVTECHMEIRALVSVQLFTEVP
jgi:hypothetical protein